jgi:hypothetical protein
MKDVTAFKLEANERSLSFTGLADFSMTLKVSVELIP